MKVLGGGAGARSFAARTHVAGLRLLSLPLSAPARSQEVLARLIYYFPNVFVDSKSLGGEVSFSPGPVSLHNCVTLRKGAKDNFYASH